MEPFFSRWMKVAVGCIAVLIFLAQGAHVNHWPVTIMDPAGQLFAALEVVLLLCVGASWFDGPK